MTKGSRQSLWPVYVVALSMIGLLFLAHRLAPSPGWRTFLDIGIVVGGYGAIMGWLETHSAMLMDRPSAEADSPTVELSRLETPVRIQYYFYVDVDPPLIYEEPAQLNGNGRVNGHDHPAETPLVLPEIVKPGK